MYVIKERNSHGNGGRGSLDCSFGSLDREVVIYMRKRKMATINYNGMELDVVTEPQIFDPPKKCVVFDSYDEEKSVVRNVVAVLPSSFNKGIGMQSVITEEKQYWNHCAILPEDPTPRRATWLELSKWISKGEGLVLDELIERIDTGIIFKVDYQNNPVDDKIKVRKWDDTEWHEPDVEYIGIEEYK